MITDLPTPQDFLDSGIAMLNLGWDHGVRLLKDLDQSKFYGVDPDAEAAPY